MRRATARLTAAGLPDAAVDTRLLLCAALGIDRAALLRDPDLRLDIEAANLFDAYLRRRLAREPVSRILGRREFWGLDFAVTPAVLDPRPDTETLVAAALAMAQDRRRAGKILDLGTGSGAILCALLSELPESRGWAVDRSFSACAVARRNLVSHGFGARSLVVQGDWGRGLSESGFDLVVSNPPYIETAVMAGLDPDVRDYDPHVALDGGVDGLEAYRSIAAQLPALLAPGGWALLEIGMGQASDVSGLLEAAGLVAGATHRDLAGIERVVTAFLPS